MQKAGSKCGNQPIPSFKQLTAWVKNEAILVANPIAYAQISQVFHDLDRGGIHEIQCATVIRFLKGIAIRESGFGQSTLGLSNGC